MNDCKGSAKWSRRPIPAAPRCPPAEVARLNVLLRGELAAVETYQQSLGRFEDREIRAELRRLRDEHAQSISQLRGRILACGGAPAVGASLWSAYIAAIIGTAEGLGPEKVLAALIAGEEFGYEDYKKALASRDLSTAGKTIIHDSLMDRCKIHVQTLHRLLADYRQY